jgi:hypothetical protein
MRRGFRWTGSDESPEGVEEVIIKREGKKLERKIELKVDAKTE